jgi:hypothetical protein
MKSNPSQSGSRMAKFPRHAFASFYHFLMGHVVRWYHERSCP